jgi:hypothetical protein
MKLTVENKSIQRETCPSATVTVTKPTWAGLDSNVVLHAKRPAAVAVEIVFTVQDSGSWVL